MKLKILIPLVILAVLVVGAVYFVASNKKGQPSFAAVTGWLFEIKTGQGVENFLVPFSERALPSNPGVFLKVLNEKQLLELTRTNKWIGPFEKHTLDEWTTQCEEQNSLKRGCTQDTWKSDCTKNPDQKNCLSFDYWLSSCNDYNNRISTCEGLPYAQYETTMLTYLRENGIKGEISNKYVGYFEIAGSGIISSPTGTPGTN